MSHHTSTNFTEQRFILIILQDDIGTQVYNSLLVIHLALHGITLEIGTLQNTVLIGIAKAIIIGSIFSTTLNRKIIILHQSRIEHNILPVIILFRSQIERHIQRLQTRCSSRLGGNRCPIRCIQKIQVFGRSINTNIGSYVYGWHTLGIATTLSSNDNDTIGCSRTIDGCRRSILQYIDALDVGRIDMIDTRHIHTINNV